MLAVVLGGRWADARLKQHETHLLALRATNAQATAQAARAKVLSTRQYTMPLLVSSSSAHVRAGLEKLIDDDAASQLAQLQKARDELSATEILPWHHAARAAKRSDIALLDKQISALDAASHGADLTVLNVLLATTPP